jgi:predicted dehydrogenase
VPLRVGLLGYGLAGAVFHAPLIAATPGLALVAIVTRDVARRGAATAAHPDALLYGDADALFAAALDLDVIVVATPNNTHASLAERAVHAGCDVVVDKPFAISSSEARRMLAVATACDRRMIPFHNRRWDGEFLTLQAVLASGVLGTVARLDSRLERWRPMPRAGWKEHSGEAQGTGLLFDLEPHLIDQALVLFGPVTSVYAEGDRRRPGAAVDDDVFLALTHASGVRSHLSTSSVAASAGARLRVLGLAGSCTIPEPDPQEAQLTRGLRPGAPGWGRIDGAMAAVHDGTTSRAVPALAGAYEQFYVQLVRCLRDGAPPPVEPRDAVAGLEIIEAALCQLRRAR